MAAKVLFVPWWLVPPEACDDLPAYRTYLDTLRSQFDVQIVSMPWVKSGNLEVERVPNSLEDLANVFAARFESGCHIVASGGSGLFVLIAASYLDVRAVTLVADPFPVPAATLRALGQGGVADLMSVAYNLERGSLHQYLSLAMRGAEDQVAGLAARFDPALDWHYLNAGGRLIAETNFLLNAPRLDAPVLFLEGAIPLAGLADGDFFRQIVPNALVASRPPPHLLDSDAGRAVGIEVLNFLQEASNQ
jgi:hypothetical protein